MKMSKLITLVAVLAMMLVAVIPASAQLGQTDVSSFTIQNVDTVDATVSVQFIKEDGSAVTPTMLNSGKPNPFTLAPGSSWEIYVPGIDAAQLPTGRYSVVISSSAQVVAIANLLGNGPLTFNGSYSGFSGGARDFFLPAITFNYYGWYSLISVQNVGSAPADVTLTLKCDSGETGVLTATGVAVNASRHFDLETSVPQGFSAATKCNGSAMVTSTQDIVAVDNQSVPNAGKTQSYSGVMTGGTTLYAPALYKNYYNWQGSLNVQKVDPGNTTVTVTYGDGGSSTCDLTDNKPGCLFYMPLEHFDNGYFAAKIESSNSVNLVGVANAATNGSQAQTYNAVTGGTNSVSIPSVMKKYYGWDTSFTCQNIGSFPTALKLAYDKYGERTTEVLQPLKNIEVYTPLEPLLANVPSTTNLQTSVTVTAVNTAASITCIVNFTNPVNIPKAPGDWSMSYNAFNK